METGGKRLGISIMYDNLLERLKDFEDKNPIENFQWGELNRGQLEYFGINPPDGSTYEQNIWLKNNLSKPLQREFEQNDDPLNVSFWIIRGWGGINTFGVSDRNRQLIRNFVARITQRENIPSGQANLLSSLSKVASFRTPEEYAIYDSRAIFSLNWMLIRHVDNPKLFIQPSGRGRATEIDIDTLISISKISHNTHSYREAYYKFCELMKMISKEIYKDENKPYLAEMLLFKIAEREIQDDIHRSAKVIITRTVD